MSSSSLKTNLVKWTDRVLLCAAQVDPLPPILRSIPGRRSHRVQKGSPIAIEYLVTTLDVATLFFVDATPPKSRGCVI